MVLTGIEPIPQQFAERWPDWFVIGVDAARKLANVPGLQTLPDGRPIVHRTHLPLLSGDWPNNDGNLCAWCGAGKTTWPCNCDPDYLLIHIADRMKRSPRPWQVEAVNRALCYRSTLVRFDPRMGKTLVAVAAHDPKRGPFVVVAPLGAIGVWRTAFLERFPNARMFEAEDRSFNIDALRNNDYIFIHYGLISSWTSMGLRAGTLVLDEAHELFGYKTKRVGALQMMAPQAQKIIALDGTPIWDHPEDLWSMLSIMSHGAWGSRHSFVKRYAGGHQGPWGLVVGNEPTNVEEFRARLSEVMIDRSWEGLNLIRRKVILQSLNADQLFEIDMTVNACRFDSQNQQTLIGRMAILRRVLATIKLPTAIAAVLEYLRTEKHVVVWAWHREAISRVVGYFSKPMELLAQQGWVKPDACWVASITGDDSALERAEKIRDWERLGGVLVVSLGVGRTAIDLSAAKRAVYLELDWTPNVLMQSDYRIAHPSREAENMYVAVDHPLERAIIDALDIKSRLSAAFGLSMFSDGAKVLKAAFGMSDEGDLERLRRAVVEEEDV